MPLPAQTRGEIARNADVSQLKPNEKKEEERSRTCARGPDEDGAELLRWRRLLGYRLCLELLDLVRKLTHKALEIRKLVGG